MSQRKRGRAVWDVLAGVFLVLLGVCVGVWPWFVLHGPARVPVGIIWTGLAAGTAAAIFLRRRDVR
jgi:drug/metabolite transporter (DMT)-like permease